MIRQPQRRRRKFKEKILNMKKNIRRSEAGVQVLIVQGIKVRINHKENMKS